MVTELLSPTVADGQRIRHFMAVVVLLILSQLLGDRAQAEATCGASLVDPYCEVIVVTGTRSDTGISTVSYADHSGDQSGLHVPGDVSDQTSGPTPETPKPKPKKIDCQPLKNAIERQHANCLARSESAWNGCVIVAASSKSLVELAFATIACNVAKDDADNVCNNNRLNLRAAAPAECGWR